MKEYCIYVNGLNPDDELATWFWEIVLDEWDDSKRRKLLTFATGSDRAPVNVLKSMNRFDESIKCFDRAIQLNPNISIAYLHKADLMFYLKNFCYSVELYDKFINLDSTQSDAFFNKGVSLYNLNKIDDAKDCFEKCIKLEIKDSSVQVLDLQNYNIVQLKNSFHLSNHEENWCQNIFTKNGFKISYSCKTV